MGTSPTMAGWSIDDFEKKPNSKVSEGLYSWCLPLKTANCRGSVCGDDDDDQKNRCTLTDKEDMVMMSGVALSQRSCPGTNLIQNCDLPPPLKTFSAATRQRTTSCTSTISREEEEYKFPTMVEHSFNEREDEKLGLLKALQLSQTRARRAERKAKLMKRDMDNLTNLLLQESLQLFAHRWWVKILELEVSQLLQSEKQKQQQPSCCSNTNNQLDRKYEQMSSEEDLEGGENAGGGCFTWCMALTLCFGIAGVGFAFGCRSLF